MIVVIRIVIVITVITVIVIVSVPDSLPVYFSVIRRPPPAVERVEIYLTSLPEPVHSAQPDSSTGWMDNSA